MSDDTQSHGEDQDDLRHGEISRRHFIEHVGFMSGTALLYAACKPAEKKRPSREVVHGPVVETSHHSLTNEQYDTVAATVERIVPRDEEPGAIDLGVPEYIDRALATPTLSHVREDFLRGTEVLMRRATARYKKSFPQLLPAEQDELLTQFKESPSGTGEQHYWTMLIGLTMEGLFGDPVHGGNRNGRGWDLIGYGSGRRGCLDDHTCQTREG